MAWCAALAVFVELMWPCIRAHEFVVMCVLEWKQLTQNHCRLRVCSATATSKRNPWTWFVFCCDSLLRQQHNWCYCCRRALELGHVNSCVCTPGYLLCLLCYLVCRQTIGEPVQQQGIRQFFSAGQLLSVHWMCVGDVKRRVTNSPVACDGRAVRIRVVCVERDYGTHLVYLSLVRSHRWWVGWQNKPSGATSFVDVEEHRVLTPPTADPRSAEAIATRSTDRKHPSHQHVADATLLP